MKPVRFEKGDRVMVILGERKAELAIKENAARRTGRTPVSKC